MSVCLTTSPKLGSGTQSCIHRRSTPLDSHGVSREVEYEEDLPLCSEVERKKIRGLLEDVARHVKWAVVDSPDSGAVTQQAGDEKRILPECPYGYKSTVEISKSIYDTLADASRKADDLPLLIILRFEFAVMMIHELAHLVHNFAFGKLDREPSFGSSGVVEIGFEVENRLFGGHLCRMYDDIDDAGEPVVQIQGH